MRFETIIGLEIHVQLKTKSKMFCGCSNESDDYAPNTAICPVCMGHPGTLPTMNRQAIDYALRLARALNFTISTNSKFDRKHYFYPDLPKGYQISQYDEPLASDGHIVLLTKGSRKRIRFERLHLEEDAAKLVHIPGRETSLVDFNRAGTPLVEMVTKPDIETPEEARAFLQELRLIVRLLNISYGDMEKGHLRCDANISLRPTQETLHELRENKQFTLEDRELWPKTEIKNMNSFRSVEQALVYEVKRQTELWKKGTPPMEQSTRGWNDSEKQTVLQRTKETSEDYRYLPEPDLSRVIVAEEWIKEIEAEMPELPQMRRDRFDEQYHLDPAVRDILIEQHHAGDFFEEVASEIKAWIDAEPAQQKINKDAADELLRTASAWLVTKLFEILSKENLSLQDMRLTAENFAELLLMFYKKIVNSSSAMKVLEAMVMTGEDPSNLVEKMGLTQVEDDDAIVSSAEEVLREHADIVAQYHSGKSSVIQFFVGQVMKKTKGRANPQKAKSVLEVLLRK